ncbi:MAG: hypothetical protein H6Q75_509 [Firmicutes bacterium]|nr:hypothetical protein [Bacillota bacterium]
MVAFITAMVFVILAEMGDKTQLLAMAFATRYRWQTVMWGVFVATIFNHLLAVVVGSYLTEVIPVQYIEVAAALSFIIFGLWTIRGDELTCEKEKNCYSPFWTVAIAFFIAEMGDKTQLATVALAAQFNSLVPVWMGTTTGMMIADGLGIIIGVVLGRKIPEQVIKWVSAVVFILFGLYGLYAALPAHYLTVPNSVGLLVLIVGAMYYIIKKPQTVQ